MSGITIYHPSKYLGGTEILFSRVIDLLIAKGFRNINVVDFTDGVLSSKLRKHSVKYYDISDFHRNDLFENTKLIASARNMSRILLDCKIYGVRKVKPMFWLLHPSELYSGYCIGSTALKRMGYSYLRLFVNILPAFKQYKEMIRIFDDNKNLWIMDGACRNESEWVLNYTFRKEIILPIITNLDRNHIPHQKSSGKKFAILSRLDDFKVHGIIKLIDDIIIYNNYNPADQIKLTIIGDGPAKGMLNAKYGKMLNLTFCGYVNNDDLTDLFEVERFSALFAMGTSALEGCSRGIPTILLPSADGPIIKRDNVYRYLHLCDGFDLGEYLETPFESSGYIKFNEVIEYFENNEFSMADNSFLFFERSYDRNVTQDKLLQVIKELNSLSVDNVKMSKLFYIYTKLISKKRLRAGV